MFRRPGRAQERDLDRALTAPTGPRRPGEAVSLDGEAERLAALARELQRLGADSPTIDHGRVWLRVQAGMLAEPQRRSGLPRFVLPLSFFAAAPRPVLAGALAIALLLSAVLASVLFQPRESASAAFLREMQLMVEASDGGPLSAQDSVALEERALSLLDRASSSDLRLEPLQSELAHQRLMEARSALAAIVGENPGDTRALAALAAISGLLDPRSVEPATATPVETATSEPAPFVTAQGQSTDATRTPDAKADDSRGQGAAPAAPHPAAPTSGSAVAAAQSACAHVYDSWSLGECKTAGATALAACAQARGAEGCRSAIEAALGSAEQRVQRVGDDCQRLPSSKARDACSEATNKARGNSGSGRGSEDRNNDGGGKRNESDSRGRGD